MTSVGIRYRQVLSVLEKPCDGSSIAVVRIGLGLLLAYEAMTYLRRGLASAFWIEPEFHFTYLGFQWVGPLPSQIMYLSCGLMGIAALGFAFGIAYRLCACALLLLFSYLFLVEEARYLNHHYAAILLVAILAVAPAHRGWSGDAWRSKRNSGAAWFVPQWCIYLLRFQVSIIYLFAGVAKLNADWLNGYATASLLAKHELIPAVGLLRALGIDGTLPIAGVIFDFAIVPALMFRRTRPLAFTCAAVFHLLNAQMFNIGIFPPMMLLATTIFFSESWPRTLVRWFGFPMQQYARSVAVPLRSLRPVGIAALVVYCAVQVLLPLRHWLYPGDVTWTEEGHRFSWRMMLRDKKGEVRFTVQSAHETTTVHANEILTSWQTRAMVGKPDMILQVAHHLAMQAHTAGAGAVKVYAHALVSLNGAEARAIVDSTVDLASQPRSIWPAAWITR